MQLVNMPRRTRRSAWWASLGLLVILSIGCEQEPVRQYQVPKERVAAHPPAQHAGPAAAAPALQWDAPEGWAERPAGRMGGVAMWVKGEGDQAPKLTVTRLPYLPQMLLGNLNRWRVQQLGLTPITEADLDDAIKPLAAAGETAQLVELVGVNGQSLTVAMVNKGRMTWYIKLMGPSAEVAQLRPDFDAFVASLRFAETQAGATP